VKIIIPLLFEAYPEIAGFEGCFLAVFGIRWVEMKAKKGVKWDE
jgi:hypothetical protein